MDKYRVRLYSRAYRDIDNIYKYIAKNLSEPEIALNMINSFEKAIYSLEEMPNRCPVRKTGVYADGRYRQLSVKNYLIIYRVLTDEKEVHIVTVRYAPSNF